LGASFDGKVAMAYATRHPMHPAKPILISTEAAGATHKERRVAMFEKLGGPEVGAMARRRVFEGHSDKASPDAWLRLAFPLYTRTPRHPDIVRRAVGNPEVLQWFTRPGGEDHTFNLIPDLARIQCPTLVIGGEEDPMTPIECQADIAAALPPHLVRFERFAACGHAVVPDAPDAALAMIRKFITG
jgi:pimeloyl-ACP methyl ester carboxylesterase